MIQETTGVNAHGSELIMSRSTLSWIAGLPNILRWFRGDTGPANELHFINTVDLQDFLKTKLGYKIRLYDSIWTYFTGAGSASGTTEHQVKFLKEGRVIILPPGVLSGNAYLATAPTSGPKDEYKSGKTTWTYKMPTPPYTWELGMQIKCFPILKSTQEIFVFDTYA